MANQYRLYSGTMFDRAEEDHQDKPLRIIFLSVEGNDTEVRYLSFVDKYRDVLEIKKGVHIHTLKRAKSDTNSALRDVLELLEEYVVLRNTDSLPERIRSQIPGTYSAEFIEAYIREKDDLDFSQKKQFESLLRQAGIDLEYERFLSEYNGEDDIFGIVIDRDHDTHTITQLREIKNQCDENGYKIFITTPLFEFWLLLHLSDIKNDFPDRLEEFRKNPKKSNKHTVVSFEVSNIAGHSKKLSEAIFKSFYLGRIDYAIKQVTESFCTNIEQLIGSDEDVESEYGLLGSNLPELFELLREI